MMKPIKTIDDPRYVKAMSHPLRVRILAMLGERAASPRELADLLGATLGTTAYHVRTLNDLGLLELVRETRVRGAVEHHYKALPHPRVSDEAWSRAPAIAKQAAIGSSLQVLHEYANASAAIGGFDRGEAHLTRTPMRLDDEGFEAVTQLCQEMLKRAAEIQVQVDARGAENPHRPETVEASLVLMLFEAARLTDAPLSDGKARARAGKRAAPVSSS